MTELLPISVGSVAFTERVPIYTSRADRVNEIVDIGVYKLERIILRYKCRTVKYVGGWVIEHYFCGQWQRMPGFFPYAT